MRETYESKALDCTPEQVTKLAYPEPEPTPGWREAFPMTPEQEALQKRLKRWSGDWEWAAPSARGSEPTQHTGDSRSRMSSAGRSIGG